VITPDHIDEVALCPTCDGLVVHHLDHVAPITGGTITWADGRTTKLGPAELYMGPPDQGCGEAT
jgi:hypothetical protein